MKWFCQIFAFYIFALTWLPVIGDCECPLKQNFGNELSACRAAKNASDTSKDDCQDPCSPFCGVNGCTVLFEVQQGAALSFSSPIFLKKQVFPTTSFLLKEIAMSIDHPPQVV